MRESLVEERGLKYDRRWVIVDEKGTFLTQRTNAQMALLDVAITNEGLVISHRYDPVNQMLIPFLREDDEDLEVKIWDDIITARTVSTLADEWLSERLGKAVRIVEMTPDTHRKAYGELRRRLSVSAHIPGFAGRSERQAFTIRRNEALPPQLRCFRHCTI